MLNNFKISTTAIIAAMLVSGAASAATVNLGGNGGLLNLGGGSGSTANVGVNSNGGGNDANLNVNLNDPSANTATLDLGNTLGTGGSNAVVDLGGTGTDNGALNLFGTGNQPTTANVNLGGADGGTLLDLFGNGGDGTNANVTLGGAGGITGTGDNAALIDLFGNGSDGGTDGTSGTSGTDGDLFGSGGGGNGGMAPVRVAALTNIGGQCFTPNATQVDKLASRHVYGDATFQTWAGASNLKVVDVGLCNGAGAAISANANVDRLQSFVAGNAALKASLGKAGHGPDDVIAADKNGKTLTVYVM